MPMYLEQPPSGWEKAMYWGLGLLMVAFIISVPFMYRDKQARLEQQWQDEGCQMYDDMKGIDVPAKCSNVFTDHYQPQEQRVQPPDEPDINTQNLGTE